MSDIGFLHSFGVNSPESIFTTGYLKISGNAESNNNWTFLLTATKSGQDDGILFSNMSGNSGFSFGFNAAHNFYFESPEGNVFTSNLNCAETNGMFLSKNGNNFIFGRYNFNKNAFDTNFFRVDNVSHGNDWFLGGTPNQGIQENSFSGVIDNFIYFNKRVNVPTLNHIFSGIYLQDTSNLGTLSITGQKYSKSGFVESGIKHIFEKTGIISGNFSIKKELYNFNEDVFHIGYISDFCDIKKRFYQSGNFFGIREQDFFIQYSGEFEEINSYTGYSTGINRVVRNLITGFDNQVVFSEREFDQIVFEFNCLNECGTVEPIFSFQRQTGIISGFNFIPLTGLVSGAEINSIQEKKEYNIFVNEIKDASCGFEINEDYKKRFGFENIFINSPLNIEDDIRGFAFANLKNISTHLNGEMLHLNGYSIVINNKENFGINLNNYGVFDRIRRKYKGNFNENVSPPVIFFSGLLLSSGKDYEIFDNSATGNALKSSGVFIYDFWGNIDIKEETGIFSPQLSSSFVFNNNKFYGLFTEPQINLPSGINVIIETDAWFFDIDNKSSSMYFKKFYENNSMVFLNGKRLIKDEQYFETSKNKKFDSGILNIQGTTFNNINDFFE